MRARGQPLEETNTRSKTPPERPEGFKTRSKPRERDWRCREQEARGLKNLTTRSTPLERDQKS